MRSSTFSAVGLAISSTMRPSARNTIRSARLAAGRRLRDVLLTPGDRTRKLRLIEQIAGWILELGRLTQTSSESMAAERKRLRNDVVPRWSALGAQPELVDKLPA